MGLTGSAPRRVGVFRLQMFKPSETFITAQAGALRRHRPIYVGRTRLGPAPQGAEVAEIGAGRRAAARLLLGDGSPFIDALGGRRLALLHAHFAVDAVFALALARRLKAPLVVTLHGFDVTRSDRAMLESRRPALMLSVLRRRRVQGAAAAFIAVSQSVRRAAVARGFDPARLHVIPTGVDTVRLCPSGPPEPGLVVHVGRLVAKKGTEILLRAMGTTPLGRLVVIGEGPLRPRLEALAGALGLGERVRFLGALPHAEALAWMARAQVVAVPSLTAPDGDAEGLPTVALEAAALGRPVVASATAGLSEAVRHGRTGLLTPPGDAAALACALDRLLDDPALSESMGAAGRLDVSARFDLAQRTAELEALYDRLLAGRA